MSAAARPRQDVMTLPTVRGKLTADAPLAPLVWFKSGGNAQWLFEPEDVADLQAFLSQLDPAIPVMGLGLGSGLLRQLLPRFRQADL